MSKQLPIVAHMVCYNEEAFIEYAIESVINYVDCVDVIEGSWASTHITGGTLRSTDGTIDILQRLKNKYGDKISLRFINEKTQLEQRNRVFDDINGPTVLWLWDADEIIDPIEAEKVVEVANNMQFECYKMTANTFVNDAFTYCPIDFPRLFLVDTKYRFIEPNKIMKPTGSPP